MPIARARQRFIPAKAGKAITVRGQYPPCEGGSSPHRRGRREDIDASGHTVLVVHPRIGEEGEEPFLLSISSSLVHPRIGEEGTKE